MNGENEFSGGLCLGFACGFTLMIFPFLFFVLTTPWLKCFLSGAGVSVIHIVGMRLRGTPVGLLTDAHIALVQSGIDIGIQRLESAYLSNPNRIYTAHDLVQIVKWGLTEADPKPPWALGGLVAKSLRDSKSEA